MQIWYICFLNDVSFQSYQCLRSESLYMLWVLAFFGIVFCLFVSKEEISGHWAMQLATPQFIPGSGKAAFSHWLYGIDLQGLSFLISWIYSRNKDAKCNSKMSVKNMYASQSYSAFFVKAGALCDPEDLWCRCMWRWTEQVLATLKESAAAERPGRLPWASCAAKSSCATATWAATAEPSWGTPQKAACLAARAGRSLPFRRC